MVFIDHYCCPDTINAYATSPLTEAMTKTVQHGIYDGSQARFDNEFYYVHINDRPEFYGLSHYELRTILDRENALEPFLVVDEQTPSNDAVWYVPDTEECRRNSDPARFPHDSQPIRHPGEDFVLWQGHMKIADIPITLMSWSVGCGDLEELLSGHPEYWPYDSHNPQDTILDLGINWTDSKEQSTAWGSVHARADWTEVEWSTKPEDRKHILPAAPVVVRLKAGPAREVGLLSQWTPADRIAPVGSEVDVLAYYDWNSPVWPKGYPDDPPTNRTGTALQRPPRLGLGSKRRNTPNIRASRSRLSTRACGRMQLQRAGRTSYANSSTTTF